MLNVVVLVGNLAQDPELRHTPSGVAVCDFTLAVNRPFTNKEGAREADFIDIVAWQKQAELAARFLKKGNKAAIHGHLQIRDYTDRNGNKRKAAEVVAEEIRFLDGPRRDAPQSNEPGVEFGDDDVPF